MPLLKFIGFVAVVAATFFSKAYVIQTIWGWHVEPLVGVALPFVAAIGAMCLVGVFFGGFSSSLTLLIQKSGATMSELVGGMIGGLLYPWCSLLIAWLAT